MHFSGGATWKPSVTPMSSAAASPIPGNYAPVTKTSLAANHQSISAIGTGHNSAARPFVNGPETLKLYVKLIEFLFSFLHTRVHRFQHRLLEVSLISSITHPLACTVRKQLLKL